MCKTFYKYFLITGTSFGACGGLYLLCLTKWLWPYPIVEFTWTLGDREVNWDWREVPFYTGLIGFLIFTPGLFIVIRAIPQELKYYGIALIAPFFATNICLFYQLLQKDVIFDPTDWYLIGVSLGLLAIIINLFLYVYELKTYGSHQLISTKKSKEEDVV